MMKILSDLYGMRTYRSRDKELYDNINTQFLCVMNGGILVQNCVGHAIGCTHEIRNNLSSYQITSTHHQMQYPYVINRGDYEILYRGIGDAMNISGDKINPNEIYATGEPEIVYYHKEGLPRCLAVQGHPEMIPHSPVAKMINNLITSLVNGTL